MPVLDRMPQITAALVALIAVLGVMHIAETFFAPVVLALVAGIVLSPVSVSMTRAGAPPAFVAVTGMMLTLLVAAILVLTFQPIVAEIVQKAPKVWADVRETVEDFRALVRGVTDAVDDVQAALEPDGKPAAEKAEDAVLSVQDAIVLAPSIAAQILLFAGTLFFFLLTRHRTYDFLARSFAGEDGAMSERLLAAERQVSRYLLTITVINASMGVVVGVVLAMIGMTNAVSWGLAAAVLNFVPYLGPACMVIGLLFAGIAEFNGFWAILPVVSYLMLNAVESQFVTPTFVGRNMALNPLAVFLFLTFFLWLWGPIGGVVAIPVLVWLSEINKVWRTNTQDANVIA